MSGLSRKLDEEAVWRQLRAERISSMPFGGPTGAYVQFAISSPATRKCIVLFVTRTRPHASACAAISVSTVYLTDSMLVFDSGRWELHARATVFLTRFGGFHGR
jgi:hypothetical protein